MARELTRECRLFYVALWNESDDVGRFRAHPRRLLGTIFPYDDDLVEADVRDWLARLEQTGRAVLYEVDGEVFGQLTKWGHQKIERPSSRCLPPPLEPSPKAHRALTEGSPSVVVVVPGPGPGPGPGTRDLDQGAGTFARAHAHEAPGVENSGGSTDRPTLEPEGDPLTPWLGEHAAVLADCPPADSYRTRRTLHSHFGPPGMRAGAWRRGDGTSVPPGERPRLLALALSGYGAEGNRTIRTSEFAGMLQRVIADEQTLPRGPDTAPLTPDQYARYREIRRELEDCGMDPEEAAAEADQRARRE